MLIIIIIIISKHVVFGKLIEGNEILNKIEQIRTGPQDRPIEDVRIIDCGEVMNIATTKVTTIIIIIDDKHSLTVMLDIVLICRQLHMKNWLKNNRELRL
jgi:hypothetical protein